MKSFARWINVAIGVWLVAAPSALGYASTFAAQAQLWTGIIVVAVALLAMVWSPARWANVVVGAWLIASPWLLDFAGLNAATYNAVIFGVAVAAFALVPTFVDGRVARVRTPMPA